VEKRFIMTEGTAPSEVVTAGDIQLDHRSLTLSFGGHDHRLTPVEAALLDVLVRNHDQIVLRDDIVRTVWGGRDQMSRSIVAVYVCALRKMLEPTPGSPRRIVSISGQGYLLRARPDAQAARAPSHRRRIRRPRFEQGALVPGPAV
jgi:DNA-binding response OmpR family regulator